MTISRENVLFRAQWSHDDAENNDSCLFRHRHHVVIDHFLAIIILTTFIL